MLELIKIPKLRKWVRNGNVACELFLKVLIIYYHQRLPRTHGVAPFSHRAGYEQEDKANMDWYPKVEELKLQNSQNYHRCLVFMDPVLCTLQLHV